jgi:hypothetical protein
MTKFILVDYENVHRFSSEDLSILKSGEFMVKLFLGLQHKDIGVDLVEALLPNGSQVQIIRLKSPGTNALDFMIAFYIGTLWRQEPEAAFYIISKDTDYTVLIKNLTTMGVDVHRRTCIADIAKDEPTATPSINDLVATATVALRNNPHRPSTPKTLRNVVDQVFKKELSEEQLSALIETLSKNGVFQAVGNKVKYNIAEKPESGLME